MFLKSIGNLRWHGCVSLTLVNFAPCDFDHFTLCLCQLYPLWLSTLPPYKMTTFPFFSKNQKSQFCQAFIGSGGVRKSKLSSWREPSSSLGWSTSNWRIATSELVFYQKHLKTHSGEKPNKCNQCDCATSPLDKLKAHLKIHSGERSNKCNQCDYASSQAGDFRKHLKRHSGEKTNKCNQCDYASSWGGDLKRHLKTHNGEKSN